MRVVLIVILLVFIFSLFIAAAIVHDKNEEKECISSGGKWKIEYYIIYMQQVGQVIIPQNVPVYGCEKQG